MTSETRARLQALVEQWRERARRIRPLESAPITAEKRARVREWMWFTNRANELAACLAAEGEEEPPCGRCGKVRSRHYGAARCYRDEDVQFYAQSVRVQEPYGQEEETEGRDVRASPDVWPLVATADAERARELCESLREGVTVLDEPFHIEALAQSMLDAADLLERLTAPVASPASPEGE